MLEIFYFYLHYAYVLVFFPMVVLPLEMTVMFFHYTFVLFCFVYLLVHAILIHWWWHFLTTMQNDIQSYVQTILETICVLEVIPVHLRTKLENEFLPWIFNGTCKNFKRIWTIIRTKCRMNCFDWVIFITQAISMAIQRGNSACILGTIPNSFVFVIWQFLGIDI